jgi:tetratricopeptide (TPR) repeat protein
MKLVIEPGFSKVALLQSGPDAFQIQQRSPSLVYSNTRIVRTGRGITCVGPTHEYYNIPGGLRTQSLKEGLWINDIGDGGSKADKFQRDIRLLTEALETEPKNPRHLFYLGNSQRDVGNYTAAIETYKRRLAVGGWDEELYMTCFYIGNCYDKMGDAANACYWWLEAYNRRPSRAESLHALCKYYRITAKHALAYMFWEKGSAIPFPVGDTLFVNPEIYSTGFLYEHSILAYYMKKPVEHRAYMRLLSSAEHSGSAISNYKFYARKLRDLAGATVRDFSETVEKVVAGRGVDTFRSSSPCLLPDPTGTGGYLMNVRYVNYKISSQGGYEFRHSDGKITTLNRLLWLSPDLSPIPGREHWFDEVANPHLRYQGVEDVRIFAPAPTEPTQFLGTVEHPTKGLISVGTGHYDISAKQLTPTAYESPLGRSCEKNWVYASEGRLIYDWSPLTVMDASTGTLVSRDTTVPAFFSLLRGSTCGVPVVSASTDELWFVCHFVEYSTPRHYYHLIVALDRETLHYRRHSTPFKFHGDPIEYCLGLVVEPTRLLFSYSCWDRSSAVISVPRAEFERDYFERPVPSPTSSPTSLSPTPPLFVTGIYNMGYPTRPTYYDTLWERVAKMGNYLSPLYVCCSPKDAADKAALYPHLRLVAKEFTDSPIYREMSDITELPAVRDADKDTLTYLMLINMKTEMMDFVSAGKSNPHVIWIDAGIEKVLKDPHQTFTRLQQNTFARLPADKIIIPGYSLSAVSDIHHLTREFWYRFCGGVVICPTTLIRQFAREQLAACHFLKERTGKATWETNVWAYLESTGRLPIQHVPGEFNERIFDYFHSFV